MARAPKQIEVDFKALRVIVDAARHRRLTEEEHAVLEGMLETTLWLEGELQKGRLDAKRLYRMLLGPRSERTADIFPDAVEKSDAPRDVAPSDSGLPDGERPDDVVGNRDRSLRDLVDVVTTLAEGGVGLRSLREAIDTTTPAGRLVFHVFAALSQFEAEVLRERTCAGLDAARRRGAKLGRPPLLTPEQLEMARTMMANPNISARQVAVQLGVHRATLYRSLARSRRRAS